MRRVAGMLFWVVWAMTTARGADPEPRPEVSLEERLQVLLKEIDELAAEIKKQKPEQGKKEDTGFLSLVDERFDLGGQVKFLLVDPQSEPDFSDARGEDGPHMRLERVRLSPRIRFTGKKDPISIIAQGDLDFLARDPAEVRARVKEFHVTFEGAPLDWLDCRLRVGLDDRFMRPPHETELWPLAGTSFWRREAVGLFFRTRAGELRSFWGRLGLMASLTNGYKLNDKESGETIDRFNMIGEKGRLGEGDSELREYGFGLGWEKRWRDEDTGGFLDRIETSVQGFYYNDSLADDEQSYFSGLTGNSDRLLDPGGNLTIRGRELWGANVVVEIGEFRVVAHAVRGRDGRLRRTAGFVAVNYRYKFAQPLLLGRYIRWIKPLVRYGGVNANLRREPTDSRTWDRSRWTVGFITELRKHVLFNVEYAFNREHVGGLNPTDPNSNELVLLLELRF